MNTRYILKKGDYYLSHYNIEDGILTSFSVNNDFRKLFADFEEAEEVRKIIFIETGLDLEIKLFKKDEE